MTSKLGSLKYLSLKAVWPHEARDFTPWLAQEENLAALGKALGLELQLVQAEIKVGPYSADILAKDGSGALVVIENQFSKTDHDHLGQLITYGATLGASIVVWVAEHFTEEHQKAIEWLNERTSDDLSLFAVRPKVIQIDDSKPAVEFEIVERPNELVRAASAERAAAEASESQKLQLEFWTLFKKKLLEKRVLASAETPRPQYWFSVPLGRTHVHISNILNTDAGKVGLRVYMGNQLADAMLAGLEKDKDAIENEVGAALQWNPNPTNRDKIISLVQDISLEDRASWGPKIEWLVDMNAKFRSTFMRRVKSIDVMQTPQDIQS
jgi:hypothetical protein